MHFYDIHNRYGWKRDLSPAAAIANNAAQVGQIIDLQGFWGLELQYVLGVLGSALSTWTVSAQVGNAANLSDAAAVAASEIIGGAFPVYTQGTHDNTVQTVGYKVSIYRYIQFTLTPAGNSTNAFVASAFILRPKNFGVLS